MNDASPVKPTPRKNDTATVKAAIVDKLAYAVGKDPIVAKPHDWLAATILVVRDRMIDRWMDFDPRRLQAGREAGLLPVAGVSDRPSAARRDVEPRPGRADRGGAEGARRRPRSHRDAGARRGARQRRPRAARRLLHGEHGDAAHSRPTAMASATSTACSTRRSRTAARSRCRRTGCRTATCGNSSGAKPPIGSASAAGDGGRRRPIRHGPATSGTRRKK